MTTPTADRHHNRLAWPFGSRQTRLPARPMHPPRRPALLWRALRAPLLTSWWPARPLAC